MPVRTQTAIYTHRGNTASELTRVNPVLKAMEMVIETDTNKVKFGDGTTAWNSLPYASGSNINISGYVPTTRKVNNKALSADITLSASDVSAAPTSHASTATTYGVASATNYGHAMASSATPLAAGTAAAGTDNGKYAREGHVHEAQTTVSGNAGTATKLATARAIALSGDVTGTINFDGSANATIPATLASTTRTDTTSAASVAFGGTIVAVDSVASDTKGRITAANVKTFTLPAAPSTVSGNAGTATKLATARTIALTGDATASGTFDGSANFSLATTLASSGVTAGSYAKVTVDAKGRVTAGAALAAADIPSIPLSKISDNATVLTTADTFIFEGGLIT